MAILDGKPLVVNSVVVSDGRLWRVGLVNVSRARLDPLTPVGMVNPLSGRSFQTYGSSINVAPTALMRTVDIDSLSPEDVLRMTRLQSVQEKEGTHTMAAEAAVGSRVATMPGTGAAGKRPPVSKTVKPLGAAAKNLADGKTKSGKVPTKKENPCKCGCGGVTGGNFVPGHDARFKGLMMKVERGEVKKADVFKPEVISAYKWIRVAGGGERTTTDYNGTAHTGYDKKPKAPKAAAEAEA